MACSSKYNSDSKEHEVNTAVILYDPSSHHVVESLLFHHGLDWAEKGLRVVYISAKPLTTLPLCMHGSGVPEAEVLKRMWFLYLSDKKELLTYLYNLHLKNVIPHVIIINNLGSYYGEDNFEQTLISASLLESVRYCGENQKGPMYLSIGISTTKKESTSSILQMFFNNIWYYDNDGTVLTQQPNFLDSYSHQFEFAKVSDNGELNVERVLKIYRPV